MKALAMICMFLIIFAVMFPIMYTKAYSVPQHEKEEAPPDSSYGGADSLTSVKVKNGDEISDMFLDDYLIGVVSAEMPASFESEALKAQAVAARTYTIYKMTVSPSSSHPDADVCTDSACCKAYASEEKRREKWGDEYDTCAKKITDAVKSTDGVCLVYEGEPILAVFHSSSGEKTESSGEIWPNQLPYLVSVESPENTENVKNLVESITFSLEEFKNTVTEKYPDAAFPNDTSQWVKIDSYTEGGRIKTAVIGGIELSGTEIRRLFSLRSAAASFSISDDAITITTTGYGHGVGMSQYGANALAAEGYSWEEILKWYYTGAEMGSIGDYL